MVVPGVRTLHSPQGLRRLSPWPPPASKRPHRGHEKLGGREEQREVCKITNFVATDGHLSSGLDRTGKGQRSQRGGLEDPGSLSHCSFKAAGPGLSASWPGLEFRHLRYGGSETLGFQQLRTSRFSDSQTVLLEPQDPSLRSQAVQSVFLGECQGAVHCQRAHTPEGDRVPTTPPQIRSVLSQRAACHAQCLSPPQAYGGA